MRPKFYLAVFILGIVSCNQSKLPDDYQIMQITYGSTHRSYAYYGDKEGNNVFGDKKWNIAQKFVDGLAAVQDGEHFGYIDTRGDVVIPYIFDCATDFGYFGFDRGLAIVKYAYPGHHWWLMHPYNPCGETALIDRKGKEVTPRYEMIWPVGPGGLAVVIESRKNQGFQTDSVEFGEVPDECLFGCIDSLGRETIPCEYDYISPLMEEVTITCKAGRWGAMNSTGEITVPCEYDEIVFNNVYSAQNIKYGHTGHEAVEEFDPEKDQTSRDVSIFVLDKAGKLELDPEKIHALRGDSIYVFDKAGKLEESHRMLLP